MFRSAGRELNGLGGTPAYRIQPIFEWHAVKSGSQTAGDKIRSREGNNPDRQLRSQNTC